MAFRISKEFHFSASHRLNDLPDGHPCGRMHGHNYVVEVELSAPDDGLDKTGFVRDYGDLKEFGQWLDTVVDHRHLNDVLTIRPQSARREPGAVAVRAVAAALPGAESVRVSETAKTWAEYRP